MSAVDEVDRHVLRKYEITQKLGKGAYAVVFKAIDKKTKNVVALKKIFDAFQNATDSQRTFREIMYLQGLATPHPHPNIIRLQNFIKAENDKDIYLVFDFMETDLHAVIRANILEPVHKTFIVYQTLKAIKYCHTADLLHRDLKPSNLLLNEECVLKVADFGLARSVRSANMAADNNSVLTDYVATRWYRAPEIILGSTSYTKAVDMWALGCIVAEMFLGKPLLPGSSTVDQLDRILDLCGAPSDATIDLMKSRFAKQMIDGRVKEKHCPPASGAYRKSQLKKIFADQLAKGLVNDDIIDFVSDMLDIDTENRATVEQCLTKKWMQPFRRPDEEQQDICPSKLYISLDDDVKYDVNHYRSALYDELKKLRKADPRDRLNKFFRPLSRSAPSDR